MLQKIDSRISGRSVLVDSLLRDVENNLKDLQKSLEVTVLLR